MDICIQYRLPLTSKPSYLKQLLLQYENIGYDYERNMIIITSFNVSSERAQLFVGEMNYQLNIQNDLQYFNSAKTSNILVPYPNVQLKLYPSEQSIFLNVLQDAFCKHLIIGSGFWCQYYYFAPLNKIILQRNQKNIEQYFHMITDSFNFYTSYLSNSLST